MNKKEHWEKVFSTKTESEVSWFQPVPLTSIRFFEKQALPKSARIIDVGSGDSHFVDYLLAKGYKNVYALDVSEKALERLKARLGKKADTVTFMASDVLDLDTDVKFDYWHDRAVFHFIRDEKEIDRYIGKLNATLAEQGKVMIGTFSESGPLKCSGLEICQYSKESLADRFSTHFKKIECINEKHDTPFGTTQDFTFCSFEKKAS